MALVIERRAGCRVSDLGGNEYVECGRDCGRLLLATASSLLRRLYSAGCLLELVSLARTGSSAKPPSGS